MPIMKKIYFSPLSLQEQHDTPKLRDNSKKEAGWIYESKLQNCTPWTKDQVALGTGGDFIKGRGKRLVQLCIMTQLP